MAENQVVITSDDIFIIEDWCYTAEPQKKHENLKGGIGFHWKLYRNKNNPIYKLWYKFYAWASLNAGMEFDIRDTGYGTPDGPHSNKGYIAIVYKINEKSQQVLIKIPVEVPSYDGGFAMRQREKNTPYNRWIQLRYSINKDKSPNNYDNIGEYLDWANTKNYLGTSVNLPVDLLDIEPPKIGVDSQLFENDPNKEIAICEKVILLNNNNLEINSFKINLECYNVQIARYYNGQTFTTETIGTANNSNKYCHGLISNDEDTTIKINIKDFISSKSLSIDLGQNKKIKAEDINTLQTNVYNEIEKRRKRYSNTATWPTTTANAMADISVTANTIIDKSPQIINNIINKGLKNRVFYNSANTAITNIANYSTAKNNPINHLNDAIIIINELRSKLMRQTISTAATTAQYLTASGCNNGYCTGLCTNACTHICMELCSFCTGNCDTSCVSTNTNGNDTCSGTCSGISQSNTNGCSDCTRVCKGACVNACYASGSPRILIPRDAIH